MNEYYIHLHLGRVSLDGVVDVDENQEQCYQHGHPPWNDLGVDQEADPGDAHEQAGGEVVCDDVETHLPGENQLKPGGGVVHPERHVVSVL